MRVFKLTLENSDGDKAQVRITNSYIKHIATTKGVNREESLGAIVLNLFNQLNMGEYNITEIYNKMQKECSKKLEKNIQQSKDNIPIIKEDLTCPMCIFMKSTQPPSIELEIKRIDTVYGTENKSKIFHPVDPDDPDTNLVAFTNRYTLKCKNCNFECHHDERIIVDTD